MFCVFLLQPDDRGFIGDIPVVRVLRQGPEALHFVSSPLDVGQEVLVKVNWERRFDHMQQHSGEQKGQSYIGYTLFLCSDFVLNPPF